MSEPGNAPERPKRTLRPMLLWSAAIVAALALAWFIAVVLVPYFQVRAIMQEKRFLGPVTVRRLGGPEKAARRIVWYLRLPKAIAPRKPDVAWGMHDLGQHAVPCLIQLLKEDEAGIRNVAAYELGQMVLGSVQKADFEGTEPDMEPRLINDAVLALASALEDRYIGVRSTAVFELGYIGPRAAAAIPALERMSRNGSEDEEMRARASTTLKWIRGGEKK